MIARIFCMIVKYFLRLEFKTEVILNYLLVLLLVQILSINVIIAPLAWRTLRLVYLSVAELGINAHPIIEFYASNGNKIDKFQEGQK